MPAGDAPRELAASPPAPAPVAGRVFGDRLDLAERYAASLATDGVVRGLIGPREAPRLWDRHLLNSAVIADLVPEGASVIDLGSGAGLPGIPLAIARPDLEITLLEPLARRVTYLTEIVGALGLDRVEVVRARAEEVVGERSAGVVTARAVAPLDRLARWALPLVFPGGLLLAMKGATADAEAEEHAAAVRRAGGADPSVERCGAGVVDPPTTVIVVRRTTAAGTRPKKGSRGRSRRG